MIREREANAVLRWVAIVGLPLLMVGYFALRLERVERVVRVGAQGEARSNPALAAERLLNRLGLSADSVQYLDELPPTDHMLFLAMENRVTSTGQVEQLLDWVSQGGYLVAAPPSYSGVPNSNTWNDPLIERLAMAVHEIELAWDEAARAQASMDLSDEEQPLSVSFSARIGLMSPGDEEQLYDLLWQEVGQGRVYMLTDLLFLRNSDIGEPDHARFLLELVRSGEPRAGAVLVHGQRRASLLGLILEHAWLALAAGAACVGVAVWRSGARRGPVFPAPPLENRSFLEHVAAAGRFLWQRKRHDALLESTRKAVLLRALRTRPQLARLSERRQAENLASATDLRSQDVETALFGQPPHRRDAFTRAIRTLENLWSKL